MAQRVLAGAADDAARLRFAFRLVTARPPSAAEEGVLAARLARLRADFARDGEAARLLSAAGASPRPAGLAAGEHAAWTALCSLLLNLDETLCKE